MKDEENRSSAPRSLGRLFNQITRDIQQIVRYRLADSGIGSGQYLCLHYLAREEGVSQYLLTEKMGTDKATTAKAAAQLEKLGYLRRERDKEDRRQVHLFLTEKGRAFLPRLHETLRNVTEICSADLTDEETEELFRLLDIVAGSTAEKLEFIKKEKHENDTAEKI